MKIILLLAVCLPLLGCPMMHPKLITNMTQDERLWAEKQILSFEVPRSQEKDAWARAQAWIGQNSSMKIQIATDHVIQTYNPVFDAYSRDYGYYVSKAPKGDNVEISVKCIGEPPNDLSGKPMPTIALNAKILTHYIKTGESIYPHLIDK